MDSFISYLKVSFDYFFFLSLSGGPGINGLLSPCGLLSPRVGSLPFTIVSVMTGVPSEIPPRISVLLPSESPVFTGCAMNVLFSNVHTLCSPSQFWMARPPASSLLGAKRNALLGTESTLLRSSVRIVGSNNNFISDYGFTCAACAARTAAVCTS